MARPKSISGGKTSRAKSKEQASAGNPAVTSEAGTALSGTTATEVQAGEGVNVSAKPVENVQPASGFKAEKAEPRKLEMVKSESRKNLVPINLEDEIRQRAFELYERRGFIDGHEAEDWLAAEREILQRYRQESA